MLQYLLLLMLLCYNTSAGRAKPNVRRVDTRAWAPAPNRNSRRCRDLRRPRRAFGCRPAHRGRRPRRPCTGQKPGRFGASSQHMPNSFHLALALPNQMYALC